MPPFGVALLAFLVFIGLELVLSLSDALFSRGAGAGEMLRLLLYKLPSLLTFAIPAGVLLATFLALGRLAADRELLAFQALGYPLKRLLLPFVVFGLLASLGSFLLSEFAVPVAEAAYRRELLTVLYRGQVTSPREHVFFRGGEGELYYVSRYDGERARGIVVYDLEDRLFPEQGPFPTLATAEEGLFSEGELVLLHGRLLRFAEDGGLEEVVRFERLSLSVGEEVQQGLLGGKTPSEMSLRELAARIALFERTGLDPRNLVVEFHSKLAIAAAALVFALFGAPLGALLGRRGRAAGAVAGFVLAAAAQGLFIWTRTLARRGLLPAPLGAWLPHLLLGVLGLMLLLSVDRLRLRGLLAALLIAAVIPVPAQTAPPPFEELWAEELTIQSGAQVIQATRVRARVQGYTLEAQELEATWDGTWWMTTVQGAQLVGEGFSLKATRLWADLEANGELGALVAEDFAGSSAFRGPEKEETLLFSGAWGKASFRAGELVRLEAKGVRFTTCPCMEGAPYSVYADRFVLLPKRWLYAEGVRVETFGHPTGWLPVYVARLGEEASPLFPEIGRTGGEWFLRWHIPFALEEEAWGALGLTLLPGSGRVTPSLNLVWDTGELGLAEDGLKLRASGEAPSGPWQTRLTWSESRLEASATGKLRDVSWSLAWGQAKEDDTAYERLPEFSLSRSDVPWLGGNLTLKLSGGRFREEGVLGPRAGVAMSWSRTWDLAPLSLSLPVQVSLDQYRGAERVLLAASPALRLGSLSLTYQGRLRFGRSPFGFDQAPPQSRLLLVISSGEDSARQSIHLGWDLATGEPLPGRWTLKAGGISLDGEFRIAPPQLGKLSWSGSWRGDDWALSLRGGADLSSPRLDDLLVRGNLRGGTWELSGGVRLSPWPLRLRRVAAAGGLELGEDWLLRAACEYDVSSGKFVQLQAGLLRTFSGCLRLGLEFYLDGVRLTLEVPAFPQAKVRFSPQDEGLRWGS